MSSRKEPYRFVVYDETSGFNTVYLDATINVFEPILTEPKLFRLFVEFLMRLEVDGYASGVLKGGCSNDKHNS